MHDLEVVASHVAPCFPPHYEIFKFFEKRYQKWLHVRMLDSIGDPSALAPSDILACIVWIQDYRNTMARLEA